ncbi:ABC transporter substrate-binding protein [Iamia majanohamensis]|uniref:ABC transporter substrate-binding protein n=1 Tax=Iamia majanohamensis TaxID=467976 RepID=A0AAE9Y7E8_9ACTN|nr:ABC transporter substrate-binding protein [Iamia majanohamensis]WCO68085.1 ABC transporter substrate-binding protein [Iamia majanohamensis]
MANTNEPAPASRAGGARRLGLALVALGLLAASACGVGAEPADDATSTTAAGGGGDEPIDIDEVVEASRDEGGRLIVYGNPSPDQWEPVVAAFEEQYPWIEVETFDLGGTEAFQRYLSEEATGATTADVIVNTDGDGWLDMVDRGQVVDYVDPELASLPDIAVAAPGVFAMSVDPLIGVFNTRALPLDEQPTTLAELAEAAEDLDGEIGTIEVENGQAGLGTFGYVDARGEEAWDVLEAIGPHAGVESGNGTLLSKLTSGEYVASFMASGSLRALIDLTDTGDVLNYRYFEDATVLPTRGMAVTAAAGAPSSARLLVNFLLSEEGQTVMCDGGFTPYREGIDCPQDLAAIEEVVGPDNAIVVGYPEALREDDEALEARWNEAFGR